MTRAAITATMAMVVANSSAVNPESEFFLIILIGLWQIRKSIKRELKLADRQRNFLLSVTHELKTPLAANKLFLQTLRKRDFDVEKRNDLLDKAISEAQSWMSACTIREHKTQQESEQPTNDRVHAYTQHGQKRNVLLTNQHSRTETYDHFFLSGQNTWSTQPEGRCPRCLHEFTCSPPNSTRRQRQWLLVRDQSTPPPAQGALRVANPRERSSDTLPHRPPAPRRVATPQRLRGL